MLKTTNMKTRRMFPVSLPKRLDTSKYVNEWLDEFFVNDEGVSVNNASEKIVKAILQVYRPGLGIVAEERFIMEEQHE